MLKIDNGLVAVKGTKIDLLAEYTTLTHRLLVENTFTLADLDCCIELAKKSEDDLQKLLEVQSFLVDIMKNVFED